MRIVISPLRLPDVLRRLGSAGACDNAYRACEERQLALLRIEAVGRRLSSVPAGGPLRAAEGPNAPTGARRPA